jgi:DNA repair exonuclease SbcCD ATPase subunit
LSKTRSDLAGLKHEQSQLKDAKYSVERDISRAQKLQGKLAEDLRKEESEFRSLQSALDVIDGKLKSTDKLKAAVGQLKLEYTKLAVEVELYHGKRK